MSFVDPNATHSSGSLSKGSGSLSKITVLYEKQEKRVTGPKDQSEMNRLSPPKDQVEVFDLRTRKNSFTSSTHKNNKDLSIKGGQVRSNSFHSDGSNQMVIEEDEDNLEQYSNAYRPQISNQTDGRSAAAIQSGSLPRKRALGLEEQIMRTAAIKVQKKRPISVRQFTDPLFQNLDQSTPQSQRRNQDSLAFIPEEETQAEIDKILETQDAVTKNIELLKNTSIFNYYKGSRNTKAQEANPLAQRSNFMEQVLRENSNDNEDVPENSSQDNMSDKSYDSGAFQARPPSSEVEPQVEEQKQPEENNFLKAIQGSFLYDELVSPHNLNLSNSYKIRVKGVDSESQPDNAFWSRKNSDFREKEGNPNDILNFVHSNEEAFIFYARRKLEETKTQIKNEKEIVRRRQKNQVVVQKVLTQSIVLEKVSQGILKRKSEKVVPTCVCMTNNLLVIGSNQGYLFAYRRSNEQYYNVFRHEDKEFSGNSVTCIDSHPTRSGFVVVGFKGGQVLLLDMSENTQQGQIKCLKTLKDLHDKRPIVTIKFCDWVKERRPGDAGKVWMFTSIDIAGRVIASKVTSVAFGMMSVDKILVCKEGQNQPVYQVMASRFYDVQFKSDQATFRNDQVTLIAIGSTADVSIHIIMEKEQQRRFRIPRPKRYPSEQQKGVAEMPDTLPCICWGYGRTPQWRASTYSMLAIAWGPLIQLIVLKDITAIKDHDFYEDGYYIIPPETSMSFGNSKADIRIESLNFINESLLVATTSTQDVRVMYTQAFQIWKYQQPQPHEKVDLGALNSRQKMVCSGALLTNEQSAIELERKSTIENPILKSEYGANLAQTVHVLDGFMIFVTSQGIHFTKHMNWEDSLEDLKASAERDTWIQNFNKIFEIYSGKVKGLRGVPDDSKEREHMLRASIKMTISELVDYIIMHFKVSASVCKKMGMELSKVREELNQNFLRLIRMVIELLFEIWDPYFLCNDLYQRFQDEGKEIAQLFCNELKPYILTGYLTNWKEAPEQTLNFNILQHHQRLFQEDFYNSGQLGLGQLQTSPSSGINKGDVLSPAENFEKILINLNFGSCSNAYKQELIEFCRKYKLATACLVMCIDTHCELGPSIALKQMRDFYVQSKEAEDSNPKSYRISTKEVLALKHLSASSQERLVLERSSVYLGLKLLWATRLFLQGTKFPHGMFSKFEWQCLCHDVLDLITKKDFMSVMLEIDSIAYFQIISMTFTRDTSLYDFIENGRPQELHDNILSVSHQLIIQRLMDFCLNLALGNPVRLNCLCFIASVATSSGHHNLSQNTLFYFETSLELLNNSDQFLAYNKELLTSAQNMAQRHKPKYSRRIQDAPEGMKPFVMCEESLILLFKKSEPLDKASIDKLVEATEETQFYSLKLNLYEKQEDYLKCLKLLITRKQDVATELTNVKMEDGFAWIMEKHIMLHRRLKQRTEESVNQHTFSLFEREVINSIDALVSLDVHKTVGLCDGLFNSEHDRFIDQLIVNPENQLKYVTKLIELNGESIQKAIQGTGLQKMTQAQTEKWNAIFSLHLRLACQNEPLKVVSLSKKICQDGYYPIDDCLKIVREFKQIEAAAIFLQKLGNYSESVKCFLEILARDLNILKFKKELYYIVNMNLFSEHENREEEWLSESKIFRRIKNQEVVTTAYCIKKNRGHKNWVSNFAPNIKLFERVFWKILKICDKYSEEVLKSNETWKLILNAMFGIGQHKKLRQKHYCKTYFKSKLAVFCKQLLNTLPFQVILPEIIKIGPDVRYKNVHSFIDEIFLDSRAEIDLCISASKLVVQECWWDVEIHLDKLAKGVTFRHLICELCNQFINQKHQEEPLVVFDCEKRHPEYNHCFHQRCVKFFIKQEIPKDKKAKVKETEIQKAFRCPICYQANPDIRVEQKVHSLQKQSTFELNRKNTRESSAKSDRSVPFSQQSSDNSDPISPFIYKQKINQNEIRQQQILKRIKAFEKNQDESTLDSDSFKLFN